MRHFATALAALPAVVAPAGVPWINFSDESATRLVSDPAVGIADTDEKDYAWDDVDHDGDIDLVVVRKQPYTTQGGRRNVLFLNEGGVLTDRTALYITGFLDLTNDRDVKLVDVNNDTWPDIVTAANCNGCNPAGIADDSRLYLNLGAPGGTWLGFGATAVLFAGGNNLNAVAAGDITGDGYPDLYFVSAIDTFEDQLLINGGPANPGAFTSGNDRLTAQMRQSDFGGSVGIADMNGDGWRDIVKSDQGPVEMLRNSGVNGPGQFDLIDPTYTAAGYHVAAGHLDGDGQLDLVISDDGVDRYVLDPVLDGAPDPVLNLPASTNGFGNEPLIADLDGDGWNDVIIPDVSQDIPGCDRTADILRNSADPPTVTFASDPGTIAPSMLTGVFDVAAIDINGDGRLDLVVGRCTGTQVWISEPFISLDFAYPGGLPQFAEPQTPTSFEVQITGINTTLEPDSPMLFFSVDGAPLSAAALQPLGGALHEATLPMVQCAGRIEFFLIAQAATGQFFVDPPGAPGQTYRTIGASGLETLFDDDMEGAVPGWSITSDQSMSTGQWELAVPNSTSFGGMTAAPGTDASPAGTKAFVTDNAPPGSAASAADVDWGPTDLTSPTFDLEGSDAIVTYSRWAFSATGVHDELTTEISNNGGTSWTLVDSIESTAGTWQAASFIVSDFVTPSSQVRVRFRACDCPNDSITEAGIDDFRVDKIICTPPCPWDLDDDGTVAIVDFLSLLGTWGSNPQGPPDFDGDGNVGITDFLELLAHWGPCG